MQFRESTRRYILLAMVAFVIIGLIVAKVIAKSQDEHFANEDLLFQQATQLSNTGNFEEASVYINELLKTQPNSEDANYLGGLISANIGEMKQASILFQKTLDLNPHRVEDPMFMLRFGETLFNVERYEDAKTVLIRCQESAWAPEEFPNYQNRVAELLKSIDENIK
ncbi:tetratricopeptide repeat protein [Lysinibacillus telephonicus]|uniref:tetratricopeptide repeat protein n=1 Tax=Lysinibacillus telephonicus TaxID=1714840 RepID=UPI003B9FB401